MKNYKLGLISLTTLVGAAAFSGCSNSGAKIPLSETCPQDLEQIERSSFEGKEDVSSDLRAGFVASQQIQLLAGTLDQGLVAACSALAKDLFVKEKQLEPDDYTLGNEAVLACTLAAEAVDKLQALAGGTLHVTTGPSECKTALDAAASCFAACGGAAPGVDCEGQVSGTCPGKCEGQCTLERDGDCSGSCEGTCSGACDSEFEGVCRGSCEGLCDGKEVQGECAGTCEGRCMEGARGACGGTCLGECNGSCSVEAAGECEGICEGECDQPLVDQHCVGSVTVASGASDCASSCEAGLLSQLKCAAPYVEVTVDEPSNPDAAELLKSALSEHLPTILASRALRLDPEQIGKTSEQSKALVEALVPRLESSDDEISEKSKSCTEDASTNGQTAITAIPTIMIATDYAKRIESVSSENP